MVALCRIFEASRSGEFSNENCARHKHKTHIAWGCSAVLLLITCKHITQISSHRDHHRANVVWQCDVLCCDTYGPNNIIIVMWVVHIEATTATDLGHTSKHSYSIVSIRPWWQRTLFSIYGNSSDHRSCRRLSFRSKLLKLIELSLG